MQPIQLFYPSLQQKHTVVITMHQRPDGDALGSTLALMQFLKKMGNEAVVISPTNWADYYNWMPGIEEVINFEKNVARSTDLLQHADILFCLDFNVMHRTKNMEQVLMDVQCTKILIDHHRQPQEEVFTYGISNIYKSSTCEMVYDFIIESGYASLMDVDIATCLYTGIMTDTGSFRFPGTSASVHLAVAHLKELGINHTNIHEHIYDRYSVERLHFLGNSLLHRMEVFYDYHTALMVIPQADLLKYHAQTGDTEGFVSYLLSIENIRFAALLIDRGEERKWSFRSKGNFDVNEFARKHFSGGGHKNAAGGISYDMLDVTATYFRNILPVYEAELLNL